MSRSMRKKLSVGLWHKNSVKVQIERNEMFQFHMKNILRPQARVMERHRTLMKWETGPVVILMRV
jgi:hypothetical protein